MRRCCQRFPVILCEPGMKKWNFRDENGGQVRFCVIIGGNHHIPSGGLPGRMNGEAQKR